MNETTIDPLKRDRARSQAEKDERPESPVPKIKEKIATVTTPIELQYKTEKDDSIKIFSPKAGELNQVGDSMSYSEHPISSYLKPTANSRNKSSPRKEPKRTHVKLK